MVASATLGAVSGSAAGAAMGLNVDVNNRQLHPDQVRLVQTQAKKLAGQQGLTAAEWEKRLLTQLAYQNSEMYVRYGNDPQAEAILTTLQSQSGVQMDYRATAAYRNDALNLQYLPQLNQAYQQLPPLNGSMSQAQFARYAGLLSGDFMRIPPTEQREVVQQLQSEYQTTLKQQLAQEQAGQSAGGQALQLAARLEVLNKLLATAEYTAVRSGAISESEASAMQRAMAAGMLVPSKGVNAKPQGVPPAKGQVVESSVQTETVVVIGNALKVPSGATVNLPDAASMSNVEVRQWYLKQEAMIPELIDPTASLEIQAKQAVELRNVFRTSARVAMQDQDAAKLLEKANPNMTWEQVVQKYSALYKGDELYTQIILASQRSRDSVNQSLGLRPPAQNDPPK
jgi:filamentous hemagglutinin